MASGFTTKVIRITVEKYDEANELKNEARESQRENIDLVTSSDIAWFSYLISLGIREFNGGGR